MADLQAVQTGQSCVGMVFRAALLQQGIWRLVREATRRIPLRRENHAMISRLGRSRT